MANEMTVNEAVRIIQETMSFGADFDGAVAFLKEHDPENSALKPFENKDIQEVKKARARMYVQRALAEDEYSDDFDEAMKLLRGDKQVRKAVQDEQQLYDKQNHITMTDEEAVLRNIKKIEGVIGDLNVDTIRKDENYADVVKLMDKTELVDDDDKVITGDDINKYWDSVIESAKMQAVMLRAGDNAFFMKKEEDKRSVLMRDIKNFFTVSLAKVVAGSSYKAPSEKEAAPQYKDFAKYISAQGKKAEKAISDLLASGKTVKAKTSMLLTDAVEVGNKLTSYTKRWAQKGFSRVAETMGGITTKFAEKMKAIWGKRHEVKQAVVEHAKNNKWRLIADTAATGIVAFTATGGMALPVVAGYALYSAAGSWAWPLVEKKTKAIRQAKAKGLDTKEWEGVNGLKKAFAEIKSDEKEYKKYKNRAYTGTAFGIAGAGLVAGVGAYANTAVDKLGYTVARVGSTALRSIGSVTNQFLNYRDVKKDFKEEPSAENRAKLQQAKYGLGLGVAIAAVGNWFGFNRLSEASDKAVDVATTVATSTVAVDNAVVTDSASVSFWDKFKGLWGGNNTSNETPVNFVEKPTEVETVGASEIEPEFVPEVIEVPEMYNSAMGISEAHWNEMQVKLTGIYANQSEIFGFENVSKEEAWFRMYNNLGIAMNENPEMFGEMTKEQVLYKYMKVIEYTERVKAGPDGFLVTKLAKDGLPVYGNKDLTETMRAMNAMINCGDSVDINIAGKFRGVMDLVDEKSGRYLGAGHDAGVTYNRYIGGRVSCGDEYQNAWIQGTPKVKPVIEEVDPVIKEVEPVVPRKVVIDEVVDNSALEPTTPAKIDEVVTNETPAKKIIITEGSTDGNLDVNSPKVIARSTSREM